MTNRLGQQLGNYRLKRLLGQGSFAEVYLGEHLVLGTRVAIKILHARVTEEDVARFEQEARLLANLRHPRIIRILDFGLDEQTPYLMMDYASNGTLRTRHAKGTQLPVSTVVGYVKQIAEALQYAHDHKVVHRDIKPENVLIGEHDEILLSDFGIALTLQSSRYQSMKDIAGTVAYMSPEQIKAHPRPASDQYSLGIVAYEWLCGTRPFDGSFTEVAIKHSLTAPPSLREHLPILSPDVEHVVLTALAKQPEERFASVSAFATTLEQASQDMLLTERLCPLDTPSPLYASPSVAAVLTSPPHAQAEPSVSWTTQRHQSVSVPVLPTKSPPDLLVPAKTIEKPIISRRKVLRTALFSATGAVVIAAVGGSIFVVLQQHPQGQVVPPGRTATPQLATATPQPATVTPQSQPFIYRGHSAWAWGVAWSPDGKRIVSCSYDNTAQVWNASDGGNVFIYRGHSSSVDQVGWSLPDGKRIASSSDDKTVRIWNASDGSNVFTYTGHFDHINALAWSPDGKRVASGSQDKTIQVWNASDGTNVLTYRGHTGGIWGIAWSLDGKQIVSGSADKTAQVWDADNGSHLFTYSGHSDVVNALSWSPDGKRIASGSWDKTVQVWNPSDGSNVLTYRRHNDTVRAAAWSPDGKRIVSGSADSTAQVWNASDGSHVFTYQGHSGWVYGVSWSPDGKQIASSSSDTTVQVWSVG